MLHDHVLPDLLAPNLKVVFCGTAVGTHSARRGAYYAGPGNKFWKILAKVGFTERELQPYEYGQLRSNKIGLTDLAKQVSGADASLRQTDFTPARLRELIKKYQPVALAFNGKKAAEIFFGEKRDYGVQPETIGITRLYVLPSTSGAASGHWAEKWWSGLAADLRGT